MLPPEKPKNPRIGPEFQAQIPDISPPQFKPKKRQTESTDEPTTKLQEENTKNLNSS